MTNEYKFWILGNCNYPDHELRNKLEEIGVKIGDEERFEGNIEFKNCDIPEAAFRALDTLWVKMFIWGLEDEGVDTKADQP